MFREFLAISMFAAASLLAGCGAPLLHTAAPVGTSVADPGFIGEWMTSGDTVTRVTITDPEDGGPYRAAMTVHHKGVFQSAVSMEVVLTEFGAVRCADLFLARSERDKLVGMYGFLALPVHQIVKFSRQADELRVWTVSEKWLERTAASDGVAWARMTVGGSDIAVLTAPTEQTRSFLTKHGDDPNAFADAIVFRRVLAR